MAVATTETAPVAIDSVTTIDEVREALADLTVRDARVTASLDALLASQHQFSRKLARLELLRAKLGAQVSAVRSLRNEKVSESAIAASRISKAVEHLDLKQQRVKDTLAVVEQVAELKACVLGVAAAMGVSQDWETAASYVHRASKIPRDIVTSEFAARIVPTTEVPDAPSITLDNAAESLCRLFLREFERAVQENDFAKITRFFKLFPLIGRTEVGLDAYGRYVCQGVAARARNNLKGDPSNARDGPYFFANVLTKLFEQIAQIIESHGPLVERHYGKGSMSQVVQRLQVEADTQGGSVLETWRKERNIDRKLTDIKSYAFTFLVQSFLPPARGGSAGSGVSSPAPGQAEDETVDMKIIDSLLNEMAMMLQRWSLYTRFIKDRCASPESPGMPVFLSSSSLMHKITEFIVEPFSTMNTFFLRRAVEKAFQLDEQPAGLHLNLHKPLPSTSVPPYISSAVDDIMYIVNRIMRQSMETSQVSTVTSVIFTLTRVLGSEFIGMVQRKMRDEHYPRPLVTGGTPPEATIVAFLVLINSLDVASDYVHRIASSQVSDERIASAFSQQSSAEAISTAMRNFTSSFESKASELLGDGVQVVHNNVIKARLRPLLSEAFRDVNYQPDSSTSYAFGGGSTDADDSEGSPVQIRFKRGWLELMLPLSRIMTTRAFGRLLHISLTALARLLEKRIWAYHNRVNSVGAGQLERDVRGLITEAVSVGEQSQSYKLRGIFARCSEIVLIMGLEQDEWQAMNQEQAGQDPDSASVKHGELSHEERLRARAAIADP
ncbi:hypothetical protein KEM52_000766 [Ascosphaera acerosa]|nr:hypothetical protein KEM52_000766 [Ascosphaera acerosa]